MTARLMSTHTRHGVAAALAALLFVFAGIPSTWAMEDQNAGVSQHHQHPMAMQEMGASADGSHQTDHVSHGGSDAPSCWEYCAGALMTTVRSIGSSRLRVVTVTRSSYRAVIPTNVLSQPELVVALRNARSRGSAATFDRTGVSGLLRTSMRLRN